MIKHKGLTLEMWSRYSLMEQLANVGVDIERTIRWRNEKNLAYSNNAFERALELIDLTLADPKNRKRRREICRVREALVDYFVYDNVYNSTDEAWQKYFYAYNYAAALEREAKNAARGGSTSTPS
jgi:hypothetical protein